MINATVSLRKHNVCSRRFITIDGDTMQDRGDPISKQETKLSKRVSHLFFGHLSTTCACGEGGSALSLPHDCATMQSAMLR